jgi:hypothetical protein
MKPQFHLFMSSALHSLPIHDSIDQAISKKGKIQTTLGSTLRRVHRAEEKGKPATTNYPYFMS